MGIRLLVMLFFSLVVQLLLAIVVFGGDVTYDGRSLIIDGQRKILFSGSIHYPRSTPKMWPDLIAKAKDGGIDVIDTYVFWNLHEPQPGQYDFSGRNDIVSFIKEVQNQGLYACLRIGPYIQGEWSYGGLPFWLHDIPAIVYRSDNEPFKVFMQNFTTKIVTMMRFENLYASQGGPIILSQIENEYGMIEGAFGDQGLVYVKWAAQMAIGLQTGVPWVMCKQEDAPDPVINSCNGMKCGEFFEPNSPNKPPIWTENWTTRYQRFGEERPTRSVEDIAFHVALFIAARNGSLVNYYMYHGGTNFGRSGSAFVTTSYYDQAPIDEYGMIRQPKWGHLKELHAAIKLCSTLLLSGSQSDMSLGNQQKAYLFDGQSGGCAAFLVNNDTENRASVFFRNASYDLPSKSISILPDCKNVAFNTAKMSVQHNTRTMTKSKAFDAAEMWGEFKEVIPNFDDTAIKSEMLLDQMSTTKDASDYLWYAFRFQRDSGTQAVLNVSSNGHVVHAFVNGQAAGSAHGTFQHPNFSWESTVPLTRGNNNVSLLSVMVGMPDSGAHLERKVAGPYSVLIHDTQDIKNITNYSWGYQIGLRGENSQIYTEQGSNQVQWTKFSNVGNPVTWYKTLFDAPLNDVPVAINLASMGKGEAWVNGQSIGRYWPSYRTATGSSQIWYHIPRSFLKTTGNLLVLLEEEGGNPLQVSLDTVSISRVCGHISTSHSSPISSWKHYDQRTKTDSNIKGRRRPRLQLTCPSNGSISNISFASYGRPDGTCGSTYSIGTCHSINSKAVVEKACLGKKRCSIPLSSQRFGGDPCPNMEKTLLVNAQCKH